jgi:hypothetical protein
MQISRSGRDVTVPERLLHLKHADAAIHAMRRMRMP